MGHDWRDVDGFRFVAVVPSGESGPDGPIESALFACEACGSVVIDGYFDVHACYHDDEDPDA